MYRKTFCRIILAHTANTFEKLSFVMLTSWLFLVKNTQVPFRGYSVPLVMKSLGFDALALLWLRRKLSPARNKQIHTDLNKILSSISIQHKNIAKRVKLSINHRSDRATWYYRWGLAAVATASCWSKSFSTVCYYVDLRFSLSSKFKKASPQANCSCMPTHTGIPFCV